MEQNISSANTLGCRVRERRASPRAASLGELSWTVPELRHGRRRRAASGAPARGVAARVLAENGLTMAAFAICLACLVGLGLAGVREYNQEQLEHGARAVGLIEYLRSPHFAEAVLENWESEFLQMAGFVVLTVMLRQRGAAESKQLGEREPVDEDPRRARARPGVPWPVRRGGVALRVYAHSLSIALVLLFLLSFAGHAMGGARAYSAEQVAHGAEPVSTLGYLGTSRFWFESFQNWQSEFLAVGMLFVLSIFLREQGSPQSKPVAAPHAQTGAG
jgi:hypothetical protein